jgi:hypothetical protein
MMGWFRRPAKPVFRMPEQRVRAKRKVAAPVEMPVPETPRVDPRAMEDERILAATRVATVELATIEWDGDDALTKRAAATTTPEATTTLDTDPRGADAKSRRIRDRYISARFPGVARAAADLENPTRVIKAARLFFEDGDIDSALELLDLAIEQDSRAESLWLAQLEIVFLARDGERFVDSARAFHAMHPASESWAEVARLGRALAPGQSLFGEDSGPRDHDHYGPWPDLPNWIQANWDLTAEVVAADFHRLMKNRAAETHAARRNPPLAA